jgi:hypothetical protein
MTDINGIKALEKARSKVWSAIHQYEERARNYRSDAENFLVTLTNETRKFLDTGIAVVKRYEDENWVNRLGESKLKYLKSINTSLDRPFIHLVQNEGYLGDGSKLGWCQYWILNVPKAPKLKNVVAGLLMVSDNTADPIIKHIAHERKWEFYFVGPEGIELKDDWLHKCENDPVFRICLGLLPAGNLRR